MSKNEESRVIYFKLDIDDVKCPICNQTGTMVGIDIHTKQGTIVEYHCINKKCRETTWEFLVVIAEVKEAKK